MKIVEVRIDLLNVSPPTGYEAGGRKVTGYWHVMPALEQGVWVTPKAQGLALDDDAVKRCTVPLPAD